MNTRDIFFQCLKYALWSLALIAFERWAGDGGITGGLAWMHLYLSISSSRNWIGQLTHNLLLHQQYRLAPTCGTIWKNRPFM